MAKTPLFPPQETNFLLSLFNENKFEEYKNFKEEHGVRSNFEKAKKYIKKLNNFQNESDFEDYLKQEHPVVLTYIEEKLKKEGASSRKTEKTKILGEILAKIYKLYEIFFEKDRKYVVFRSLVENILKNNKESDVKELEMYLKKDKSHLNRHKQDFNSFSENKKKKFIENIQENKNEYILNALNLQNFNFKSEEELGIEETSTNTILGHFAFMQNRGVGDFKNLNEMIPEINGQKADEFILNRVNFNKTLKLNDIILQMLQVKDESRVFEGALTDFSGLKLRYTDMAGEKLILYNPNDRIKELIPEMANLKSNNISQYIFLLQKTLKDYDSRAAKNIFKLLYPKDLTSDDYSEFRENFNLEDDNIERILRQYFSDSENDTSSILDSFMTSFRGDENMDDAFDLLQQNENENFEENLNQNKIIIYLMLVFDKYYDNVEEVFDKSNESGDNEELEKYFIEQSKIFINDLKKGVEEKIQDIRTNKRNYVFLYENPQLLKTYTSYLKKGWGKINLRD